MVRASQECLLRGQFYVGISRWLSTEWGTVAITVVSVTLPAAGSSNVDSPCGGIRRAFPQALGPGSFDSPYRAQRRG